MYNLKIILSYLKAIPISSDHGTELLKLELLQYYSHSDNCNVSDI